MSKLITRTITKKNLLFLVFILLIIISTISFASLSGLPIESNLEKYLGMVIRISRFVVGFGIIFTAFTFFKGSQMWMIGFGIIMVALIIGNLDTILNLLGMTGGVVMP